ncbi:MAG: histone deacetylase, partial [Pseudomonadota bacterium]
VVAARPDLVLYNAGVDPWEGDRLGRLAVSLDGLARRERAVLARLVAAGLPVAAMLGGGYGDDPAEVAARHALLFAAAAELRLI